MERSLDIITSVLPERSEHLPETVASVKEILKRPPKGWKVRWRIGVDGPEAIPAIDHPYMRFTRPMGASRVRNALAQGSDADYLLNLDGDDLIDPMGVRTMLEDQGIQEYRWVSANLLLINGAETSHWVSREREWKAGELAGAWVSPFPFHPGTLLMERELVVEVGGWPDMETNEDLALTLLLSERASGFSTTYPILRYRIWEAQTTSRQKYARQKMAAFRKTELIINQERVKQGRHEVVAPIPGPASGR